MVRIFGLIKVLDQRAYEKYRSQVGETVTRAGGTIVFRASTDSVYWNELGCESFDAIVQLEFPSQVAADAWAKGPDYRTLLPIRSKAMRLLLFSAK